MPFFRTCNGVIYLEQYLLDTKFPCIQAEHRTNKFYSASETILEKKFRCYMSKKANHNRFIGEQSKPSQESWIEAFVLLQTLTGELDGSLCLLQTLTGELDGSLCISANPHRRVGWKPLFAANPHRRVGWKPLYCCKPSQESWMEAFVLLQTLTGELDGSLCLLRMAYVCIFLCTIRSYI